MSPLTTAMDLFESVVWANAGRLASAEPAERDLAIRCVRAAACEYADTRDLAWLDIDVAADAEAARAMAQRVNRDRRDVTLARRTTLALAVGELPPAMRARRSHRPESHEERTAAHA